MAIGPSLDPPEEEYYDGFAAEDTVRAVDRMRALLWLPGSARSSTQAYVRTVDAIEQLLKEVDRLADRLQALEDKQE